jgi:hypothetical protein
MTVERRPAPYKENVIMKKHVKILTYCTGSSIGSILQSYALTRTLENMGHESAVWLEAPIPKKRKSVSQFLRNTVRQLYRKPFKKRILSAYRKRTDFIKAHMTTEIFSDYSDLKQRALECQGDVFLSGSDQVWNPDKCSPTFFLDFVEEGKRVSYAASMGKTEIPSEKEPTIEDYLSRFDRISVREQECADALQKLTDHEIAVHVDPTFLQDRQAWKDLEKPYRKVKGPYILLYMLYWDKSCKEQIVALKKRTGLPVYAICPDVSRVYADKHLYDVGVEEFLWLIDHAEYVITSSFHGVALSIQFQKQFAAVVNPGMPSRIANVLNVLQVPHVSIDELDTAPRFDYDKVAQSIEKERNRSIDYLKEAIE